MWQGIYQGLQQSKAGIKVLFSVTICSAFGVGHLPGSGISMDTSDVWDLGKLLFLLSQGTLCVWMRLLFIVVLQSAPIFLQCCSLNKRQLVFSLLCWECRNNETHPLLMFLLMPIARAGLCSPSHDHRCGDMGEDRDVSMTSPAVLIVLHHWWQGGERNVCFVSCVGALPPCLPEGPNACLCVLKILPTQLWITFLPAKMDFNLSRPTVIILEKWCQLSLYIPWQKWRGWGQSPLESRKSSFQGSSKSLKGKISQFLQAIISRLVLEDHFCV